jgi:NAD(P)-dependent dehydrogenase (short-subunit alcohol dehydrogenase family)
MERGLEGKVVIITGAAGGIGRETSRVFAAAGAKLVVADISQAGLDETVKVVRADGFDAVAVVVDVGSEESVQQLVAQTVKAFGRLDGAFNNAGVEGASKPLTELTLAEWDRAIRVDLTGVFLCMKHEIPAMLANGGGSIVNTSSAVANLAFPGACEYITAKAGVLGLTRAAAVDFGGRGIRVNAILPGVIRTPMMQRIADDPVLTEILDRSRARHALGRFGESSEVGEVARWLLSDASSFVQGASIDVDGGYSMNGG